MKIAVLEFISQLMQCSIRTGLDGCQIMLYSARHGTVLIVFLVHFSCCCKSIISSNYKQPIKVIAPTVLETFRLPVQLGKKSIWYISKSNQSINQSTNWYTQKIPLENVYPKNSNEFDRIWITQSGHKIFESKLLIFFLFMKIGKYSQHSAVWLLKNIIFVRHLP